METEKYKEKKRKSFIPHETSFTVDDYKLVGWNREEHRHAEAGTAPDYPIDLYIEGGFPQDTNLYALRELKKAVLKTINGNTYTFKGSLINNCLCICNASEFYEPYSNYPELTDRNNISAVYANCLNSIEKCIELYNLLSLYCNYVSAVGKYALVNCSNLKDVYLTHSKDSYIKAYAFNELNSNLSNVTIDALSLKFGSMAFARCGNMQLVISNLTCVPDIGMHPFYEVHDYGKISVYVNSQLSTEFERQWQEDIDIGNICIIGCD